MDYKIIKSPTIGTIEMLNRRRSITKNQNEIKNYDAIGLVQGKLIDMVVAADVAEKAASVEIEEIRGICPQHFTLIAIFGDTASVEAAINAIKESTRG
jgi:ethanolamine utilization microcompartment shell protein EutL